MGKAAYWGIAVAVGIGGFLLAQSLFNGFVASVLGLVFSVGTYALYAKLWPHFRLIAIDLPDKWAPRLQSQPETASGHQIATVVLNDGRRFEEVTISVGVIVGVAGYTHIPFAEPEIADIIVTRGR